MVSAIYIRTNLKTDQLLVAHIAQPDGLGVDVCCERYLGIGLASGGPPVVQGGQRLVSVGVTRARLHDAS